MTDIGVNVEDLPNLASSQLGTEIVFASDEWFAEAPNMLQDAPAVFDENTFTEYGKEMDGWESRRRRTEGHDWCIIDTGDFDGKRLGTSISSIVHRNSEGLINLSSLNNA